VHVSHAVAAGLLGDVSHEFLPRREVKRGVLVGVLRDRRRFPECWKRCQEVCLTTIAGEFAIEALDVLTSGIETISIGGGLTEEVLGGWQYGNVLGTADRPLGERCAVLLACDVVGLFERLAGESVVADVDEAGFERDEPKRIDSTLVFAAVEPARPERDDALAGSRILPCGIEFGDDILAVTETCDLRVDAREVPVGELGERTLNECPVVGSGRGTDVLGKRRTELRPRAPVGSVVLIVGEWLLAAGDVLAADCDSSDDTDGAVTLWTSPCVSFGRRFESECLGIFEVVGIDGSGSAPRHFGIEYDIKCRGIDGIGSRPPAGDGAASGFEVVLLDERAEGVVVGVTRELPAVFDIGGLAVVVVDGDVPEGTLGDRVVVGEVPIVLGVSPRSEELTVGHLTVGVIWESERQRRRGGT